MSKLPVMITVDSVGDLPIELAKKYNIMINPYMVETEHARFIDVLEVGDQNLVDYLNRGKGAISATPKTEEYRWFFDRCLSEKADTIIHITMGRGSHGYERAMEAVANRSNIHVFDSLLISSAMAILALRAAELVMEGKSVEEILDFMTKYRKNISSEFLVKDLEYMYRSNRISKGTRELSYRFMFRAVLWMKKGEIARKKVLFGEWDNVVKKYIRQLFSNKKNIDTRRVFITYVDLDEATLEYITYEVERQVHFDEIIYMPATAAISCNCGKGTFAVIFGREKNRNIPSGLLESADTGHGGFFHLHRDRAEMEEAAFAANKVMDLDISANAMPVENTKQLSDAMSTISRLHFIDYATGLMYSADNADLYLEILREYIRDDKAPDLEKYKAEQNWDAYRVLAHALKGTSKTIGAMELSEEARLLEYACKDGTFDYIEQNHSRVMDLYHNLCRSIWEVIG